MEITHGWSCSFNCEVNTGPFAYYWQSFFLVPLQADQGAGDPSRLLLFLWLWKTQRWDCCLSSGQVGENRCSRALCVRAVYWIWDITLSHSHLSFYLATHSCCRADDQTILTVSVSQVIAWAANSWRSPYKFVWIRHLNFNQKEVIWLRMDKVGK